MAVKLGLVLAIACTILYGHAYAQSGCTSALVSLSPCLTYINGNSSTPTATCCSQLDSVVKAQPQCLCLVLGPNAGASLGVTVNQTQALALPSSCNVQTPSPTLCSSITGSPTASPATPTDAPPSSVLPSQPSVPSSSPATPSGTATKSPPASSTPSTNGSPMNSAPSLIAIIVIFLISCASAAGSF